MPTAVNEEVLKDPQTKVLDINKPPLAVIPHQEFPKMVYLHPKDKTKEARYKVVENKQEQDEAAKQGYQTKPHVPQPPPDKELEEFEYEAPKAESKKAEEPKKPEEPKK